MGVHEDDAPTEEETELEDILLAEGIVEETPAGTDLRLTDEFEQQWHQRSTQMRGSDRALRWFAGTHDAERDRVETTTDGELFVVEIDGSAVGKWPSETAFLAETVVRPTLREWIPEAEWEQLSEDRRRELSAALLLFLERCPACDEELDFTEEVEDGSVHVSLTCPSCDATLFSGSEDQERE